MVATAFEPTVVIIMQQAVVGVAGEYAVEELCQAGHQRVGELSGECDIACVLPVLEEQQACVKGVEAVPFSLRVNRLVAPYIMYTSTKRQAQGKPIQSVVRVPQLNSSIH